MCQVWTTRGPHVRLEQNRLCGGVEDWGGARGHDKAALTQLLSVGDLWAFFYYTRNSPKEKREPKILWKSYNEKFRVRSLFEGSNPTIKHFKWFDG